MEGRGQLYLDTQCFDIGKHLRKAGSILTSLRILKCRCSANIFTLGIVVFGLGIVPDCNAQNNRYMKLHCVKLLD